MANDFKPTAHDPAAPDVSVDDIVFECPMCGKAMVIGKEGAGEIVMCPSCDQEVIVPGGPLWDKVATQLEVESAPPPEPESEIAPPIQGREEESLSELRARLQALENQRKENEAQRTATADAIAHALNQATRFKLTLQRLEEKQRLLESEITTTRDRIQALERLV